MAIAYDSYGVPTTYSTSSVSFDITVGSGDDRILIVFISAEAIAATGLTSISVKCNGHAMTQLFKKDKHTAWTSAPALYAFYKTAPSTGTNTILVEVSGSAKSLAPIAISFSGVHQTNPIFDYNSQIGVRGAFPQCGTFSCVDGMVIDGVSASYLASLTVGSGQTSIGAFTTTTGMQAKSSYKTGSGSIVTMYQEDASGTQEAYGAISLRPTANSDVLIKTRLTSASNNMKMLGGSTPASLSAVSYPGNLLGKYMASTWYHQYLRFPIVNVPKDALIKSASLMPVIDGGIYWGIANVDFDIHMEDNTNPVAPTSIAEFSALSWLTTTVTSTITFHSYIAYLKTRYTTADIKALIQEIVSKSTWVSGRPMAFWLDSASSSGCYTVYNDIQADTLDWSDYAIILGVVYQETIDLYTTEGISVSDGLDDNFPELEIGVEVSGASLTNIPTTDNYMTVHDEASTAGTTSNISLPNEDVLVHDEISCGGAIEGLLSEDIIVDDSCVQNRIIDNVLNLDISINGVLADTLNLKGTASEEFIFTSSGYVTVGAVANVNVIKFTTVAIGGANASTSFKKFTCSGQASIMTVGTHDETFIFTESGNGLNGSVGAGLSSISSFTNSSSGYTMGANESFNQAIKFTSYGEAHEVGEIGAQILGYSKWQN